ncbi:MAG: hypothetical protein K5866_06135 [Treponema sp.]|nr:hypothetical protein [Treponema sp.]
MLKNIRNPFPRIGKIYKYEFLNVAKILLPLYGILLILGLINGLTTDKDKIKNLLDSENPVIQEAEPYNSEPDLPLIPQDDYDLQERNNSAHQISYIPGDTYQIQPAQYFHYESSGNLSLPKIFTGVLVIAFSIFIQIIMLVTFIIFARRFRKAMFGEEAYLNLSLPITIGEHIWGRFLCYFTWILICFVTVMLSGCLSFIKIFHIDLIRDAFASLNTEIQRNLGNPTGLYIQFILVILTLSILILSFIFFINTLASLYKKHGTLLKIISIVITLSIFGKVLSMAFTYHDMNSLMSFSKSLWKAIVIYLGFSTIFMSLTHLILSTKLNLE